MDKATLVLAAVKGEEMVLHSLRGNLCKATLVSVAVTGEEIALHGEQGNLGQCATCIGCSDRSGDGSLWSKGYPWTRQHLNQLQ